MNTTIRRASTADFEAIKKLFLEFYLQFNMAETLHEPIRSFMAVDDADAFASGIVGKFVSDTHITFIALDDQTPIGYISGTVSNRDFYKLRNEAEIIDWFVTKEYRSSGVGKQLYNTLIEGFKIQKCELLKVEAFADNIKTIDTYERMGFVKDSIVLKKKI